MILAFLFSSQSSFTSVNCGCSECEGLKIPLVIQFLWKRDLFLLSRFSGCEKSLLLYNFLGREISFCYPNFRGASFSRFLIFGEWWMSNAHHTRYINKRYAPAEGVPFCLWFKTKFWMKNYKALGINKKSPCVSLITARWSDVATNNAWPKT